MIDTNIKDFRLKVATNDDVELIFYYIKKLAIYEKMEDQVIGNVLDLEKYLFNENVAEVYIAYECDIPVGFTLLFKTFSTFLCKPGYYIEDVYIDELYRNKGYGKEIFITIAKLAYQKGYSRVEWVCLDWNEPSLNFYNKSLNACAQKEWVKFRLDETGIRNLISNK